MEPVRLRNRLSGLLQVQCEVTGTDLVQGRLNWFFHLHILVCNWLLDHDHLIINYFRVLNVFLYFTIEESCSKLVAQLTRASLLGLRRAKRHQFELCPIHYLSSVLLLLHTNLSLGRRAEKKTSQLKNKIKLVIMLTNCSLFLKYFNKTPADSKF